MAAAPQSRPEPMNVVTHHAKVRTTLRFAEQLFVAGGMVTGKMEMECKADKGLAIGVIMVELYAIEGASRLNRRKSSSNLIHIQSLPPEITQPHRRFYTVDGYFKDQDSLLRTRCTLSLFPENQHLPLIITTRDAGQRVFCLGSHFRRALLQR